VRERTKVAQLIIATAPF